MPITDKDIANLVADLHDAYERAVTDLREIRERMARLGITVRDKKPVKRKASRPAPRTGKAAPTLKGWLRMALRDGVLPQPTDYLHISPRIIEQAKQSGFIEGDAHPYRCTAAGRAFAKRKRRFPRPQASS